MVTFRGWSTANITPQNTKTTYYDFDLVKQDLLNELMTKIGDRVMLPNYGCIVWDLLFELQNDAVVTDIQQNIQEIVSHDPRLTFVDCVVSKIENGYTVSINVVYNPNQTLEQIVAVFQDQYQNN